ncbi:MAG: hypothetical protein ACYS1A_05570 [Planctomycetota bacterium]|jgi:hypothetical protein
MNKDMPNNASLLDPTRQAFDIFIGFVYAVSIGLLIETVYLKSSFDNSVPIAFTLLLLIFFAQDWMVRYRARQQMVGETTKKASPYYIKLLIEIAIVYFLLLSSLRLVELYTSFKLVTPSEPLSEFIWKILKALFTATLDSKLCYIAATFAILSWLWNLVMVKISLQVNRKQIWALFKGHLDEEIVKVFPIIKKWEHDFAKQAKPYRDYVEKLKLDAGSTSRPVEKNFNLWNQVLGHAIVLWFLLKSIAKNPHYLVVPYLLIIHIVTLNFVLGGCILLSACCLKGNSIYQSVFGVQPSLSAFSGVLLGLLVLPFIGTLCLSPFRTRSRTLRTVFAMLKVVCLAITILLLYLLCPLVSVFFVGTMLFLGFYFANANDTRPIWVERLGCVCLAITTLLLYSICSWIILIHLIFCQQIVANVFMSLYFDPSAAGRDESVPHATEVVTQGGQT